MTFAEAYAQHLRYRLLLNVIIGFEKIDQFGACHIVVADGNVEDHHIDWCLEQPDLVEEEREFLNDLRQLPVADRERLWEASIGR